MNHGPKRCETPCRTSVYVLCVLSVLFLSPAALRADTALLARSYFSFVLADRVVQEAQSVARGSPREDQEQLRAEFEAWRGSKVARIRADLDAAYGAGARAELSAFEEQFLGAEVSKDPDYLQRVFSSLGLTALPHSYEGLRDAVCVKYLAADMKESAVLLSEAQTWLDVRRKVKQAPPFKMWLARDQAAPFAAQVGSADAKDLLAYAEPEFDDAAIARMDDEESTLDSYGAMHKSRRDRVMEEARAGMEQVAAERRAAEEEYGARKLAEAEKEAEAIKRHAQTLADVEKEALAQREASWGNRLKRIVTATVSAAGSAFVGPIGAEAGRLAADAIFN